MYGRKYILMLNSKVPGEGFQGLEVADIQKFSNFMLLSEVRRTFQRPTKLSVPEDEDSDAVM
jgi:hypothetical protein